MRTVIISHSHPRVTLGGGELAAYRHFEHLREKGEDAHFVGLTIDPADGTRIFGPSQRVITLGAGDHCARGRGMDSFDMEHEDLAEEDWLVEFLAAFEADVYHFHHFWNVGAGTIRRLQARVPRARLACTLHEFTAICANHGQMIRTGSNELCRRAGELACTGCFPDRTPFDFVVRRRRMMSLLSVFDVLISPSRFLRQRFEDWGIPEGRIRVLENGMPPASPPPAQSPEEQERRSWRLAYFGQATPTKGLDLLVQAAHGLEPRVGIDVHGVTEERFRELWPSLEVPPAITFKGRYDPAATISTMRRYGWVIVPSIWWENSPLIIQEARAAGVPVIAADLGGMAEKAADFGYLVQPRDALSLHGAIAEVAGRPERMAAHAARIRPPMTVAEYDREWRKLVAGRLHAVADDGEDADTDPAPAALRASA